MRARWVGVFATVLGTMMLLAAAVLVSRSDGQRAAPASASITVAEGLRGRSKGYARAHEPRMFHFPADHGPHRDYRTEWWYFTGNLETPGGRHFGYQLTLFRIGLDPDPAPRVSIWAASQVFMGHFAVTDVRERHFQAFERLSRAALGLAGAETEPLRVWLEDWSVTGEGPDALPIRLRAAEEQVAIDLTLESAKPVVLQGEEGLSRKSAEPGNASYYYSLTRMPTAGSVRLGSEAFEVRGLSWMDREWSTSALAQDQVGWDWLALQLSDGSELMLYRLRRRDGSIDPVSAGTLVEAGGGVQRLGRDEVQVEVLDHWRSRTGNRYPSRWRLRVPQAEYVLEIEPYVADQELALSVRYWEGAVRIRGTRRGAPVTGSGYVELTGYGDEGVPTAGSLSAAAP